MEHFVKGRIQDFWITETKLFYFHRTFKNGEQGGGLSNSGSATVFQTMVIMVYCLIEDLT